MVEWNINHRMMSDKVNSSIASYDFEGLAKWFNSLDKDIKADFRNACRDSELYYYDFAELISTYYEQNPDIVFAPNHYRKLIDWLFKKAWYCDAVTVHQSLVIARLLDLMLYYRMIKDGEESSPDYIRQRVSIFDPLLTNLIKYRLYDDAWKIAASCYFQTARSDRTESIAWQKTFLRHLARIGKYRGRYDFKLTQEMKDLALDGMSWISPNWRAVNHWWKKSQ